MSSKQRRGGLGRGLGALIPTAPGSPGIGPSAVPSTVAGPASDPTDVGGREETPAGAGTPPVGGIGSDATSSGDGDAAADDVTSGDAHAVANDRPAHDAAIENVAPVPGASFQLVAVSDIHANPKQPRQVFDEDALTELAHSIREFGVLQPVVVRTDTQGYELVMGERRLRAATLAGLDTIPAIVRDTADDAMLRDALLENIHRVQLNPLEEAAAYQQLLEEFGVTHDELAGRIGRSRPQVSNTIRLLNLPLTVQRRVAAGVLSAGHARALLSLDDAEHQDELAARIVSEGLSVRATEELVTLAGSAGPRKAGRRSPAPRISAPAAADLAERLSDLYDTRVRVDLGRRKGRISVEFASIDDLERIVAVMAPQLRSRSTPSDPGSTPLPNAVAGTSTQPDQPNEP